MDFRSFYVGGKLLLLGLDPYLNAVTDFPTLYSPMNADKMPYSGFVYPPFATFLFVPLAMLPYATAKLVYSGLSLLGLWGLLLCIMRQVRVTVSGGAIALVMCSFPVLAHFERGQIDLWVCYLTVMAFNVWHNSSRPASWRSTYAATLVALACSIKIFPFVTLIYWLVKRQYRLVVKTIGLIFGLLLAPILYFGPAVYQNYGKVLLPNVFGPLVASKPINLHSQSVINGVVNAIDGQGLRLDHDFVNGYMNPLLRSPSLSLPIGLTALAVLLFYLRRQPIERQFFSALNGIHLINPKTWIMGLVWYIPMFLYWFDRANNFGKFILVLPLFCVPSSNANGMLAYAIALGFAMPQVRDRYLLTGQEAASPQTEIDISLT
ncbi:glycosyltransferase family 87 protein [Romeriopsis navalis]|nr:glycosyltransferase family 87 protein [Romeriopsis navalis]